MYHLITLLQQLHPSRAETRILMELAQWDRMQEDHHGE